MTATLEPTAIRTRRDLTRTRVLRALSTTLVATLSDAFDLVEEERLYLGLRLDDALSVLEQYDLRAVPLGVGEEMRNGVYSRRLATLSARQASPHLVEPGVRSASLQRWCAVISDQIRTLTGDQLDAVDAARMDASLVSTLEDLGVGERASRYLPNAVRYHLNDAG